MPDVDHPGIQISLVAQDAMRRATAANSPLVLPADKVQTCLANPQSHEAQDRPLSVWHTHNLKTGEKPDSVARIYGISAARLKQLNGINARSRIAPGFALLVPGRDAIGQDVLAARLPQTPTDPRRAAKAKKGKAVKLAKAGRTTKEGKTRGARRNAINVKIRKPAAKPKKR